MPGHAPALSSESFGRNDYAEAYATAAPQGKSRFAPSKRCNRANEHDLLHQRLNFGVYLLRMALCPTIRYSKWVAIVTLGVPLAAAVEE